MMFILQLIDTFFWIYMIFLFVRILGSWIPDFQDHPAMRFVATLTDPYLNVFRRIIPPLGMIDLSPIVAFLCLKIIEDLVKEIFVTLFLR